MMRAAAVGQRPVFFPIKNWSETAKQLRPYKPEGFTFVKDYDASGAQMSTSFQRKSKNDVMVVFFSNRAPLSAYDSRSCASMAACRFLVEVLVHRMLEA